MDAPDLNRADGSLSSLDKLPITQDAKPSAARQSWLRSVEKETDAHRIAKAQHHTRRAYAIRQERLEQGASFEEAAQGARWHARRAWGQIDRFQHVQDCGAEKYWLVCSECTAVRERTATCRVPLLCLSCRGAITVERRAQFHFSRNRSVDRVRPVGLLEASMGNDRWSEKLLTLTAPHCSEHSVTRRIELLFAGWPLMRDSMKKSFAKKAAPNEDLVAWFRSFEWEIGSDGKGHPHFHFWWLSPYIKQSDIKHWWRCALATAGYERSALRHVIVDIREVRDGKGAAREVIKYLTKDILPDRSLVSPDIFARVYETLDGRRLTQASAGFFKNVNPQAKCSCGAVGCFRRTKTPPVVARTHDSHG